METIGFILIAIAVIAWLNTPRARKRWAERQRQREEAFRQLQQDTEIVPAQELTEAAQYFAERLGETGDFSRLAGVSGVVRCDAPLKAELSGQPCVYYSMKVARDYEEIYSEIDRRTRGRVWKTRPGSEIVASNTVVSSEFWVEDATGRVLVIPRGATIEAIRVVDRYEQAEGVAPGYVEGARRLLGHRREESIIPVGQRVFVCGEASDSSGRLAMQLPETEGKSYVISYRTRDEVIVPPTPERRPSFSMVAMAGGLIGVWMVLSQYAPR